LSGGAILGDRIRMQSHSGDPGIFIRSMATRGFLGGLARATADAALVLDAAGKDVILIETVGVGQDEIAIVQLADCVVLLLVPGLGDDIQNVKAGLMEIADPFVVNKADREGAERLEERLRTMLAGAPPRDGWLPPVVRTVATENAGIAFVAEAIAQCRQHCESNPVQKRSKVESWKRRLLGMVEVELTERVFANASSKALLADFAVAVAERKKDPFSAVQEVLARGIPVSRVRHRD
jgi:LAO/AO transport system kinase